MPKSIWHALKADSSEEEDDKNDVREGSCDIDDFAWRSNAFDHAHIHQAPGNHQREAYLPVEHFWGVYVFWDP